MKQLLLAYLFMFFIITYGLDMISSKIMDEPLFYPHSIDYANYIYYNNQENTKDFDFMLKLSPNEFSDYVEFNPDKITTEAVMSYDDEDKQCPKIFNYLWKEEVSFKEIPLEVIKKMDFKQVFVCKRRGDSFTNVIDYILLSEKDLVDKNIAYIFNEYFNIKNNNNICDFFNRSRYTVREPLFLYQKEFYRLYSDLIKPMERCEFFKKAKIDVIKNIYPDISVPTEEGV